MRRSLKTETIIMDQYRITRKKDRYLIRGNGRKFTLNEIKKGRWRLFGIDSEGSRRRPEIEAKSLESAMRASEKMLFGGEADSSDLLIADVFFRWRAQLSCTDKTKKEYWAAVKRFCDWVDHRQLHFWRELRLEHIQTYANEMAKQDYSKRYLQLLCQPIRQCARWAMRNWPESFRNWTDGVVLRSNQNKGLLENRDFLSFEEVTDFLCWLREKKAWNILPGVALQSLCSCRVREVVRLEWKSVDLEAGTVAVEGRVKNVHSIRRLPLPQMVHKILVEAPKEGNRVLSRYDGDHDSTSYSRHVLRMRRRWNAMRRVEPKGLRRTIPSEAIRRGWGGYALERFLGHSATGITEKHYVVASENDLVDLLREQIVSKVDAILGALENTSSVFAGNVIPFPGQDTRRKKVQKKCNSI